MDSTYLEARIVVVKAQIEAYEDAILQIASGAVEEYLLDTGQTRTRVKKQNLASLEKILDSLYNRLCTMETRLNGSGVLVTRPSW